MKPKVPLFEPSIMLVETVRKRLKEVVKNQESVIDRLCDSLLSKSFRDKDDQRVLYAALLNGTSGCWKTTLAREFARIMDEELKKELGPKFEFKFWKIDLGSYHSCEIPTLVGWFTNGWGSSGGESKVSKFEEIMMEIEEADPVYCRGCIFMDEIDKALRGDWSTPATAIDKLSELWDVASPMKKRKDAKQIRFNNVVMFLGANFFTNTRVSKTSKIGFGIENDGSGPKPDPNDVEPIDKDEIRKKLGEYLTVSSMNRFDDIHIFENVFSENVTKEILAEHFENISENILRHFRVFDAKRTILPSGFVKPKAEDYLDEVYANADKQGWIRSLKRTLELRIKPKITEFYLSQLTPEFQHIFIQAQHAENVRVDLKRLRSARREEQIEDEWAFEAADNS